MKLKGFVWCVAFPYAVGAYLGYKHKQEKMILHDVAHDLSNENIERFLRAIS